MTENVSKISIDDKTKTEFEEMGIDVEDLQISLDELSADKKAQDARIKNAIVSGDLSQLNDQDVFEVMQMMREAYDKSSPEEQAKILQSLRGATSTK